MFHIHSTKYHAKELSVSIETLSSPSIFSLPTWPGVVFDVLCEREMPSGWKETYGDSERMEGEPEWKPVVCVRWTRFTDSKRPLKVHFQLLRVCVYEMCAKYTFSFLAFSVSLSSAPPHNLHTQLILSEYTPVCVVIPWNDHQEWLANTETMFVGRLHFRKDVSKPKC